MDQTFSPLIGILGGAVLGGTIGLQRQAASKPAGFRTHLLVAMGSAAFAAIGSHLHDTRIPSYVVVGIGFLGSGAIVRQGATTQGLTTAASIWIAAAIGLAMGYASIFGLYVAVLITVLTLAALSLSDGDLMRLFGIRRKAMVRITCTSPADLRELAAQTFRRARVRFESSDTVSVDSRGATEIAEFTYLVDLGPAHDVTTLVAELSTLSGVARVAFNEPGAT